MIEPIWKALMFTFAIWLSLNIIIMLIDKYVEVWEDNDYDEWNWTKRIWT